MKIIGHRGAAGYVAENTLASLARALELDVDGIEVDVQASRDGEPVVIHDASLERTTNGTGLVSQHSWAQLRLLRTGDGQSIPSLREVLQFVRRRVLLNIEIKARAAVPQAVALVREFRQQQGGNPGEIIFSSFDHGSTDFVRRLDPSVSLALLVQGLPPDEIWNVAARQLAVGVNLDLASVTREFVQLAHARQLQVGVYTVNRKGDADRLRAWQVDAIFSDLPDVVADSR